MSPKEHFRMYVAAYLVLMHDDQILLLRRYNTGYQDGKYSLVAGHLDGGETAEECIVREAQEEANITLDPNDLAVAHIMHRKTPEREYIDIFLTAHTWTGELKNMEPNKCDDLRWFPKDALPTNIIGEVQQALHDIRQGIHYGHFGW